MASFDSSAALATIATLEKELARLKGMLGVGDGKVPKSKVKRERNPDAKPNPWIEFVKRLHSALKDEKYDGPATVVTLFGKAMKDLYPDAYSLDEEMLRTEFRGWLTPERLEHARSLKRGSKAPAEEKAAEEKPAAESGESAAEASEPEEKKERKKRAPMTEEAKAAMAAKRAATKALSAAAKAAGGGSEKPSEVASAEKPKKAKAPTYTVAQLTDWEELTWEGEEFGRNIRGDVIDGEGNFVGHWDGKGLDRSAPKPADWDTVMA